MDRTIRTCRQAARRPARHPIGRTVRSGAAARAAAPVLASLLLLAPVCESSAAGQPTGAPELRPLTAWGAYLSALHASRRKNSGLASAYFATVTPRAHDRLRLLIQALRSHVLAGRIGQAATVAERTVALSRGPTMARLVLAVQAAKQQRFSDVQRHLGRIRNDNVSRLLLPLLRAWAALGRHKDPDLALDEHRDLEDEARFRPFLLMHRAFLLDAAGRPERAAQAYETAARSRSIDALRLTVAASNFQARSGDRAAALATVDRYLAVNPDSMIVKSVRAQYLSATPVRPLIGSPADGLAEALLNVASALDRADRAEQALPLARLAVWLRPRDAASVFLLGTVLEADGRHRDALDAFRRLETGAAYDWEARKSAAASMVELRRYDDAAAILEKMAVEKPERYDALWLLGNVHRNRSAFGDAVTAYDRALKRVPDIGRRHWNLLYVRGIALERSGQWARAEADFLRALELNPGQPYVLNYLAYSWVDRGERLERARTMLEAAVKKRPNDGYIVDSVGWVEYRLGNFEAAVRHLERATELRPHDPIINQHLGDAYWRAGRRHEARFQWNRALWLGPEDAARKKIERRLRKGMPPFEPIMRQ